MFPDFQYVIIYTIAVIAVLVCYIIKVRRFGRISFFLLVWWAISAIASSVFFWFYYPLLYPLSPEALIFYFIGFLIMLSPLRSFDETSIVNIEYKPYIALVKILSAFLGIICILPLIENLVFISSHNTMSFVADQHEALNSSDYKSHLSYIAEKLHNLSSHFSDILGILLFVLVLDSRVNKKYIVWILLVIFEQIANSVANGSRGYIVYLVILNLASYKLFYNHIEVTLRKKINRLIIVFGVLIISLLSILTTARLTNNDVTYINATEEQATIASNSLYLGEAPVRFASFAWGIKEYTYGHSLFDAIVSPFDGVKFKNSEERRNWVHRKTGIKYPQVFYGFVGFSYIDFGFWGAIIFLVLFSCLFKRFCATKKIVHFPNLILMVVFIKILIFSTMLFPYCYAKFYDLLYLIVLYLFMKRNKTICHAHR